MTRIDYNRLSLFALMKIAIGFMRVHSNGNGHFLRLHLPNRTTRDDAFRDSVGHSYGHTDEGMQFGFKTRESYYVFVGVH